MSLPNTSTLTDAELIALCELVRRNRVQYPPLSDSELATLEALALRLKFRPWPHLILPAGTPWPTIVIPHPAQATMVCDANLLGPGGGV